MSSNEVKVGALTLGGIGLLAGIITFLGAFSFSGSGYKLQISYPQVGGLMPGHVVRYAGVQVGTVKEVNVNGDSVDVVADINKDIKIPKGAVFSHILFTFISKHLQVNRYTIIIRIMNHNFFLK